MSSFSASGSRAHPITVAGGEPAWTGWPAAVLVALLGAAIRFYGLADQSLWADEIASAEIARAPLNLLWSGWMVRETNPPLYYAVLHVWMGLFGQSDLAVRSLSACAGTVAILLIYALGRDIASRRTALIAALLTDMWVQQLYFSQEARGYMLGACGALVAIIGVGRIADNMVAPATAERRFRRGAGSWLAYLLGSLVAIYTHTTHLVLPVLANAYLGWIWLFRSPRRAGPMLAWVGMNALLVVLWSWWGWITWQQLTLPHINIGWIPRPTLKHGIGQMMDAYGPTIGPRPAGVGFKLIRYGGSLVVLTGAVLGALRLKRERMVLLASFGIGAPLLLFLASQAVPVMLPRTFLWAQFAVILAFASALAALQRLGIRVLCVGASLVGLALGGHYQGEKQPWRDVVVALKQHAHPGDVVLVRSISTGMYVQHYCDLLDCRLPIMTVQKPNEGEMRWAQGLFRGPQIGPAQVGRLAADSNIVWTVNQTTDDVLPFIRPVAHPSTGDLRTRLNGDISVMPWRAVGRPD